MISICDPVSHWPKGVPAKADAKSSTKRSKGKSKKKTSLAGFCEEFASEIDLFDSNLSVPAWVFDYRDNLLRKISPELKKICRNLRQRGLDFKIKWPVKIDGKWKFADVYFPRQCTVLMVTNAMALGCRPHWALSDRAEFFRDRYRVVEVENLDELNRRIEQKKHEHHL